MTLVNEIRVFLSTLGRVYRVHPNTVAAHRGDLTAFSRFLGDLAIEAFTVDQVRKYVARIPNHSTREREVSLVRYPNRAARKRYVDHFQIGGANATALPTRTVRIRLRVKLYSGRKLDG